ncbi:MAG: SpoIID/LytB domain-containing protein [Victivallaceae bacterium]
MRHSVAIFLLLLFCFCCREVNSEITVTDSFCETSRKKDPILKVLLVENATTVLIESKGPYDLSGNGVYIGTYNQGKRANVHGLYGTLRWGEQLTESKHLVLTSTEEDGTLFVNGLQYKGSLHIYLAEDNLSLSVVNEISSEDFLRSVLSVKYLKAVPKEALSAFVILERTAFYERLLAQASYDKLWHLRADQEGYLGYGVTKRFYGVEEAVDWTMRLILDNPVTLIEPKLKGEIEDKIIRLAAQGFNAKQILEVFYPEVEFMVIDGWDEAVY